MMTALHWYQWIALAALAFCLVVCLIHFFRLISLGKPVDYAKATGNTAKGVLYSFTGAMSPAKKESAYLHLPTYTAGLLYHIGNFFSFFLFFFIISGHQPTGWIAIIIAAFLCITAISGISILLKRIVRKELRSLSNPDDFISNLLVTFFEFMTMIIIILPSYSPTLLQSYGQLVQLLYYLAFILLALYIPAGKLRHTVYFFAARYHLGFFFGRRGIWPRENFKN